MFVAAMTLGSSGDSPLLWDAKTTSCDSPLREARVTWSIEVTNSSSLTGGQQSDQYTLIVLIFQSEWRPTHKYCCTM